MTAFDADQLRTATSMRTTVAHMNALHDNLHYAMGKWLGVNSYSMRVAEGEVLTPPDHALACVEEDAVLAVQKYVHALENADVRVPLAERLVA
jgi:hypothetical protein